MEKGIFKKIKTFEKIRNGIQFESSVVFGMLSLGMQLFGFEFIR